MLQCPVLVLDNGASTVKAGLAGSLRPQRPSVVPNLVVRQAKGNKNTFIGHEIDSCVDFASLHLRRPFERGFLTDWDSQKAVWDGIVSQDCLDVATSEASLLVTEPYFNLPNMQEQYDQIIFESYDFQSYARCARTCPYLLRATARLKTDIPAASLIPYGKLFNSAETRTPECMIIVDSGFSFTHVVPLMCGKVIWPAIRRVDVGGKLLTNYLKEMLSYRQFDLMGETYIANDVKEKCCYVATNYTQDVELSRSDPSKIAQEYILPRFADNRPGRVKGQDEMSSPDDDVVKMGTERFAIPELLFRPSDIGLAQAGLAHTIANAISATPEDLHGLFWANIGLIGGNVAFPGFKRRLTAELRSLAPAEHQVTVYEASNPITAAYDAGAAFASQAGLANLAVTRAEYQESGSAGCRRKFEGVSWVAVDPSEKETEIEDDIVTAPAGTDDTNGDVRIKVRSTRTPEENKLASASARSLRKR